MLPIYRANKEFDDCREVGNVVVSDTTLTNKDAINHNDREEKETRYADAIKKFDKAVNQNDDKNRQMHDDQDEKWYEKYTKLSTYDLRNSSMWKNVDGDKLLILVLFVLYILQGVPLGLKSAIPLVLQERGVGLDDQSVFSVSNYPFSMKILWAPIVDSVFIKKFGRRKSWLIPTQTVIGDT